MLKAKRQDRGFTLVELLVVVGIIALLIGVLLPALNRARETSFRVACASNMHVVGVGVVMFEDANKGVMPRPPVIGMVASDDGVYWQPARRAEIGVNGLGPYLKLRDGSFEILRCPGDAEAKTREGSGKYPFTFSFNDNMNGTGIAAVRKVGQVRQPADKILMIEENGPTLNDGSVTMWAKNGGWASVGMLGLRHDRGRRNTYPDAATAAGGIVNPSGKANVLFVDGHVAYVTRSYAHSKFRVLPDAGMFAEQPELGP